jgi:two-component system CheB/CheR fusion protein
VTCRFECNKAIELNDNFVATHLYRISQEAVTNALRHSQPDSIQISLNKTDDLITLRIIDNGIGIDESRDKVSGMGLRIMAYRAGVIGAALQVGAGEQGGTAVTCTLSTAQA